MAHRVAPLAEADLDDIWFYVAKESGSVEMANRLIDTVTDRFLVLAGFPTSDVPAMKAGSRCAFPLGSVPSAFACLIRRAGTEVVNYRHVIDWLEIMQRLASGARAKVAEDRRRLEELQAQRADARDSVEAPASGR